MLTRLYIDNFRCFEKFEWRPGRKQLILGRNGCGKTSVMDAFQALIDVASHGERIETRFDLSQRNRWLDGSDITFELDATVKGEDYKYRLILAAAGVPPRMAVREEELSGRGGHFLFKEGQLTARSGDEAPVSIKLNPGRTALASAGDSAVAKFREWLDSSSCWHLNPLAMESLARGEDLSRKVDFRNFASWYRYHQGAFPERAEALKSDLRESLDGFDQLLLRDAGDNNQLLSAVFCRGAKHVSIAFTELSDGQRCLICLYAIAHFEVAKGGTVIIDEPDNFLSLREIQPWLMGIEDLADDHGGQVILISHHPEILNQWANPYGVQFVRDGAGRVQVQEFKGDPESTLTAAELVARGWDLE